MAAGFGLASERRACHQDPMFLRWATHDDLDAIRAIHLANWQDGHRGVMPDDFLETTLALEMKERWADLPTAPDLLMVAEDETGLAGFALVRTGHDDGPLLESLHVAASHRGGGVGEMLMRVVAVRLGQLGHDRLWLDVLEANAGARRFYARMGGVESPPFTDILAGHEVLARKVVWTRLQGLAGA